MSAATIKAKVNEYLAKVPVVDHQVQTVADKLKIDKAFVTVGTVALTCFSYLFDGGNFLLNIVGFAYPAYCSINFIEGVDKDDDTHWLTYWLVFGLFKVVESVTDIFISATPLYFLVKMAFLVYLFLPQTHGAKVVYENVVRVYLVSSYLNTPKNPKQDNGKLSKSTPEKLLAGAVHVSEVIEVSGLSVPAVTSSLTVDLVSQTTIDTHSSDSTALTVPAASVASITKPASSAPSASPSRNSTATPHFTAQDTVPTHSLISGLVEAHSEFLVVPSTVNMSSSTSVLATETARAVTTTATAVLAAASTLAGPVGPVGPAAHAGPSAFAGPVGSSAIAGPVGPAALATPVVLASVSGPSSLPHPRTAHEVDAELLGERHYGPASQGRFDGLNRFIRQRTAEVKEKLAGDNNTAKLSEELKLIQEAMWKLNGASDSENYIARDYYMKSAVAFLEAAELVHSSSTEKENKKSLGTALYKQALQMHREKNR